MPEITINSVPDIPTIASLIQHAKEHPPAPVVEDLLHEGEIAGLHGSQESFKTILMLQFAESLATGRPFLDRWTVPKHHTPYFFETEMSESALGRRLSKMFLGKAPPDQVKFADEARLRRFATAKDLSEKFALLSDWVLEAECDVAIIDTCNPFFRGRQSPNDETIVGEFFDRMEALPVTNKIFVRHNHKARIDDSVADDASRIRGSGQFADVPDLLIEIKRTDKRVHKAEMAITKYRHGTKPQNLDLWFDSLDLRLISIPPVVHLLREGPRSRQELLDGLHTRFGVGQRLADDQIKSEQQFLSERNDGHRRIFEIDLLAAGAAGWYPSISGK